MYIYIYTNIDSVEGWQVHFGCSLVVYIHVMFVRGPDQCQRTELYWMNQPGTSQALRENRTWGQNDVVQSDIFRDVSLGKLSHWFCRCSDEGKLLQCYVRWSNSVPGSNVDSSLNFSASTASQAHHNCNQVEALMHIKNHRFGVHHSG